MHRVITTGSLAAAIVIGAFLIGGGIDGCSPGGALPAASCGTVERSFGTVELSAASGQDLRVLQCFVTAAAACKAASIHVGSVNGDVVNNEVYAVDPGGTPAHCTVSDSKSTSLEMVSNSPVTTTRCRTASVHPASATITCHGGQRLVLLATLTYTLPRASCGSASVQYASAGTQLLHADRGALTCFATAASACKPAGLQLAQADTGGGTYWVFVIAGGGTPGRCAVTGYIQDYSATRNGGVHTRSPNRWVTAVATVPCREASVTSKGVTLNCSGTAAPTVLIPATSSAP
jgi:hypothetical protein